MAEHTQPDSHPDDAPIVGEAACSKCGHANVAAAQFCSNCGRPLDVQPPVEPEADRVEESAVAGEGADVDRAGVWAIGRLFVIPLIIVVLLIGALLASQFLGWATLGSANSPMENLQVIDEGIEAGAGESGVMGAMSPRSKRVMRAAKEFAGQAGRAEPGQRKPLAAKVGQMLEKLGPGQATEAGREDVPALRYYLIMALGALNQPESVDQVAAALSWQDVRARQAALLALANMREHPQARTHAADVARLIYDSRPEVQIQAAHLAGSLGERADTGVVRPLTDGLAMSDMVAWNAALSLVKLNAGVERAEELVRETLLSRDALESMKVEQFGGAGESKPLDAGWVQQVLVGAAEVAGRSGDRQYVPALQKLVNDKDAAVNAAALKALKRLNEGTDG